MVNGLENQPNATEIAEDTPANSLQVASDAHQNLLLASDYMSNRYPPNDGRLAHDTRDTRVLGTTDFSKIPAEVSELITGNSFKSITIDNLPSNYQVVHALDSRGYYLQFNPPNAAPGEIQQPRKRLYYPPDLPSIDLKINGVPTKIDLTLDRQRVDQSVVTQDPNILRIQDAYRTASKLEAIKGLPNDDPAMRFLQNMNALGGRELNSLESVYREMVERNPNNAWAKVGLGDVMTLQAIRNLSPYMLGTLNRTDRTPVPLEVKQQILRQLDAASDQYRQAQNINGRWQHDNVTPFRSPYLPNFDFNPWAGGFGFLYWGTGADYGAYRQTQVGVLRGLVDRNVLDLIQIPPNRPEYDPTLPPNPSRLRIYERGVSPSQVYLDKSELFLLSYMTLV
ncbi:MAG: hypothetical protein KIT34_13515 [Cyanobacteria bacterium TGS_CYA1]|nr:hypothetical protein [Cyanobacteria bacterium TGS_CYA1]